MTIRHVLVSEPTDVRPGDLWRRSGWRWFERGDQAGDQYLADTIRARDWYPLDLSYLVEIARKDES